MAIPKFTANISLNFFEAKETFDSYSPGESLNSTNSQNERIIPSAPYWGDFKREDCISGKRKYSSILWGATGSWEKQCRETPAYITNTDGETKKYYAAECDNQGFNMWGIFYVPESSCKPSTETCYCSPDPSLSKRECELECYSWCCEKDGIGTCSSPLCSE